MIVRNDLSTGTTHEFLIYRLTESGVNDYTVESEPVSVTCEVPIAGQTNFISASGDVFGDDGHIYLYPNKAAAVNIICMSWGKVVKCVSKDGLAMTGTTAGYVYPIEDDSENWLYQVRGTGIYRYCGGDNIAVSTTRAGTTAPARNSTTGFAYFVYRGHEFLVHNSGKNYLGGLTIRNLTTDKVIASFDPSETRVIQRAAITPYPTGLFRKSEASSTATVSIFTSTVLPTGWPSSDCMTKTRALKTSRSIRLCRR